MLFRHFSRRFFSLLGKQELSILREKYQSASNLSVFGDHLNERENHIPIYNILVTSSSTHPHILEEFLAKSERPALNTTNIRPSDTYLLMQAKLHSAIGQHYARQKNLQSAVEHFQKGLNKLEQSLVPPAFQYYWIYREYGLILANFNKDSAVGVLTESVEIIAQILSSSQDHVPSQANSLQQAVALGTLARIDPANREKWVGQAKEQWGLVEQRYKSEDFSRFVRDLLDWNASDSWGLNEAKKLKGK